MTIETPELDGALTDADIAAETKAINKIKAVPTPPIEGVVVKLCGLDAVVPPLKAKHIRKFTANMEQFRKATPETSLGVILDITIPVIHAALTRNYPSLTIDDVYELIDAATFAAAIQGVMAQSGYRAAKPGE